MWPAGPPVILAPARTRGPRVVAGRGQRPARGWSSRFRRSAGSATIDYCFGPAATILDTVQARSAAHAMPLRSCAAARLCGATFVRAPDRPLRDDRIWRDREKQEHPAVTTRPEHAESTPRARLDATAPDAAAARSYPRVVLSSAPRLLRLVPPLSLVFTTLIPDQQA
jgi:hypothetical protein